jgi:hypothetical protein
VGADAVELSLSVGRDMAMEGITRHGSMASVQ